jgi:hypothetical protein
MGAAPGGRPPPSWPRQSRSLPCPPHPIRPPSRRPPPSPPTRLWRSGGTATPSPGIDRRRPHASPPPGHFELGDPLSGRALLESHRLAPRGAGTIVRTAEHRAGLEAVVLSSFTTQNPVTARETTLRGRRPGPRRPSCWPRAKPALGGSGQRGRNLPSGWGQKNQNPVTTTHPSARGRPARLPPLAPPGHRSSRGRGDTRRPSAGSRSRSVPGLPRRPTPVPAAPPLPSPARSVRPPRPGGDLAS